MHIGVMIGRSRSKGGVHQYELSLLDGLASLPQRVEDHFTLFGNRSQWQGYGASYPKQWALTTLPKFTRCGITELLRESIPDGWFRDTLARAAYRMSLSNCADFDWMPRDSKLLQFLSRRGIDWLLYTAPTVQAFQSGMPYVMPVHDLQHRLQPSFPEVSAHGAWEHREYLYRNGTRHATLILADSEVGREDIVHYYGPYGVTADRVKVLPFVPPPYLTRKPSQEERTHIRNVFNLPERYMFYPSHLWPHKNHVRLVQAIGLLRQTPGIDVQLVLSGGNKGAVRSAVFREVMTEAERLHVTSNIHYLGYVPHDAMSALYAEATSLVMPTFFGPTNIPVVEAWLLGCPVLSSDIRGIREQVGDAGLLVDPRSVDAIADGIQRLWEDAELRAKLAQRGRERLATYDQADFAVRLAEIIDETNLRVREQRLHSEQ
jgi:glycosyltransferase involved in cell wall biosynthesis